MRNAGLEEAQARIKIAGHSGVAIHLWLYLSFAGLLMVILPTINKPICLIIHSVSLVSLLYYFSCYS